MSNGYYNGPGTALAPFTTARAEDVAAQFQAVAAGFEALPSIADLSQARIGFLTDSGGVNAITVTLLPAPSSLASGINLKIRVIAAVTGPATINLNGLGAKALVHSNGVALSDGDINADDIIEVVYDGNAWRIIGGGSAAENAATRAQAAAASAINAPGTSATSNASRPIQTGTLVLPIQPGKLYELGQTVVVAYTLDPTKQMVGIITAYDRVAGSITVNITNIQGTGTYAAWTVSLSAITGSLTLGSTTGTGLATGGGNVGFDQQINVPAASATDILVGTNATKALTANAFWNAQGWPALTDAATIAVDMATGVNFAVTLNGNRTLANPTNAKVGQCGEIEVTQGSGGSKTLAYGSAWKFPGGAPTLSTTAGKIDLISYKVRQVTPSLIIHSVLLADMR